jgi:hypothetical protein
MNTCKVCSKKVRKTSIALILRDGTLKGARVCQGCLSALGVTIVVAREVPRCKCGQPATKCHACAGSKSGDVQAALKVLTGRLKLVACTPADTDTAVIIRDAKCEALEGTIELLKSGRF